MGYSQWSSGLTSGSILYTLYSILLRVLGNHMQYTHVLYLQPRVKISLVFSSLWLLNARKVEYNEILVIYQEVVKVSITIMLPLDIISNK